MSSSAAYAARDAYWLGLIDEVIGQALDSPRMISEFRPDPDPETQTGVDSIAV